MQETEYRAYLNNIALTKDSPYFSPDIYIPEKDRILLETVEHCPICKKGFISRWGRIRRCHEHDGLEETTTPRPIYTRPYKSSWQENEDFDAENLEAIEMIGKN